MYTQSAVCFRKMLSPATHREGLLHAGSLPSLCTYLQPWRGTAHGLRSFRTCTTTRMHLESRSVTCKQYCLCKRPLTTYNLYRGDNCCTTHIAKATDVFSRHDCIFHVEQPPERVQLIDATAAVTAATPPSMPVPNLNEACV